MPLPLNALARFSVNKKGHRGYSNRHPFVVQESTIGAAFLTQTVAVNDVTVKFEIWDTGKAADCLTVLFRFPHVTCVGFA